MTHVVSEDIHDVWDTLTDFEAGDAIKAATHLMTVLTRQVGASNATWAGAVKVSVSSDDDPLKGWRVAAMHALHPAPVHAAEARFQDILRLWDEEEIDPSFLLPLGGVGTYRTYSLRRELPAEWFESPFYKANYGAIGTYDAAFVAFPLSGEAESHFGFYSRQTFTNDQISRLSYALRGIKWFHRHLMLSHGLLTASSPLTPSERKVLQLLLTDATEKRIAGELGMAASTVHQYVVSIRRAQPRRLDEPVAQSRALMHPATGRPTAPTV